MSKKKEFWGIIYKIIDLDTSKYYIGLCRSKNSWNSGYMGSGVKWTNHLRKYPNNNYKRIILEDSFKCEIDCIIAENRWINKFFNDPNCYNLINTPQGVYIPTDPCEECGYKNNLHSEECSHFNPKNKCKECGGLYGHHMNWCSKYTPPIPCNECGGLSGNHKKTCSKYTPPIPCNECGGIYGHHKEICSKYISRTCKICGGKSNNHKKGCKYFKESKPCNECGGKSGNHKKGCSKYNERGNVCDECGEWWFCWDFSWWCCC